MAKVTESEVGRSERKVVDALKSGSYEGSYKTPEIQVFRRRWLMLFLWAISNIMQGVMGTAMASSVVLLSKYYRVSQVWIEWTSTIWSLSNIIFTIPSAWVLKTHGLKPIVVLCASTTAVGNVLLLGSVGREGFLLAFAGMTIASVGSVSFNNPLLRYKIKYLFSPFIFWLGIVYKAFTNAVSPRLANVWFGPSEVSTANCVGILANSAGAGLGFLAPSFLLEPEEGTDGVRKGLEVLNWSMMLFNAPIFLATLLWYEEKPPIAPSKSMLVQEEKNRLEDYGNLLEETRVLLRNTGYLCAILSCAINQGVGNVLSTILDVIILAYFPDGQKDVGVLGMLLNIIGVPALVLSGQILDKTKKFQETIMWTLILNGISALAILLFLHFHSMEGIYVAVIAFGIFNGAIAGLGMEMIVELTYPISEGSSVGWLMMIIGIGTVVLTNFCGSYVNSIGVMGCMSIFVILLFLGAEIAWCVPKKYQRQKANHEENANDSAEVKQREINRF